MKMEIKNIQVDGWVEVVSIEGEERDRVLVKENSELWYFFKTPRGVEGHTHRVTD